MRIGYSEEEQFDGQFNLWQANCYRSLHGKKGQAALRELEAALIALPTKRLIAGKLVEQGDVCAIGALALHKGATEEVLEHHDDEYMEGVGMEYGLPKLVAWKVVEANDIEFDYYVDTWAPGPAQWVHGSPGYRLRVPMTPEQRYTAMLGWVRSMLAAA